MRYWYLVILFAFTSVNALAEKGQFVQPNNLYPKVKLMTTHGDIVVELDRSKAPLTVNNFLSYVKENRYNNTIFHRLEPEFVLQGGGYDAQYKAIEEYKPIFNESGNGSKNQLGTIAMARLNDPHSATSQFFFNLADNAHLDPGRSWGYAVFGYITEGMDVIEKIRAIQTDTSVELGWPNVPVEKVILKTAVVLPEQ
ncbi:peptidylprolyl isomerase [Rheinheimera baltica]|uniref:Peptidyl-prolyl cis-trans isomerase n=1 Tax=Rheinheimera baltica TaxID=67576 RepID=A0ABT9HZC8_9GAMM|nr:peptidylprolyl isomerase [Rheinheimera baltica]MDP5136469.1 peptidylprolyl isomerase [Rheinheimera baltica]MDP5144401.1 peptidylprolyl isomerase [Rheinheimera baltica]MDP5151790.1 peptidylprolyl isomerase [Rheinheimera baltica]MDP5190878.1 peptidylprolyl isomerase [Rheinheimera baltica]